MTGDRLTVGAIGVGPVGSILAAHLAEAGAKITAVDLPERIAQIEPDGLQVHWRERLLTQPVATVDSIGALAGVNPDCIFIATKVALLSQIMPEVAKVAGESCLVISVQNGIGTEDEIARYVPSGNVARMVVNYAGGNDDRGVTRMVWFNPPNSFGLLSEHTEPRLTRLVEMLNSVGFTSERVDSVTIKKNAFRKTILNAALMPLCAVTGLTMKQAMSGRATRQMAGDILGESLNVAERLGYDYGDDCWQKCMGYLDGGGDHHPSMSVDIQNKRPTEIEFINGKILEIGQRFDDVDLSVNRVLTSLLMSLEVKNGTRSPDDLPGYLLPDK